MKILFSQTYPAICLALMAGLTGCADSKTTHVVKQKTTANEKASIASTGSNENQQKPSAAYNKTVAMKPITDVAAFTPRTTGKLSDRFPNILLQTHDGRSVRFYDDVIKNHIVIVNFMYTSCTGI